MLAFTVLEHALLKSEAAPLRNALIKAGLGSDVISSFDNGILQPMFSIIVNGSEANKVDEFTKVVTDTLNDIVKNEIMSLMKNNPRITITDISSSFLHFKILWTQMQHLQKLCKTNTALCTLLRFFFQ